MSVRGLLVAALLFVVGACAGVTNQSAAPSAEPRPSQTTNPPPGAASASSSTATFTDWVARQGFGGGSGLVGLSKAPRYLREHASSPGGDLDTWTTIAEGLERWLGEHAATACWAGYHEAIAGHITTIASELRDLRDLAKSGTALPIDRIQALEDAVQAAQAVPNPASCD